MNLWRNPGTLMSLLIAGRPKQAAAIAVVTAGVAAIDGRSGLDLVSVLLAVFLGRLTFGLLNDVVDRGRDEAAGRQDKPIALGYLDPGTATFAVAVLACLIVPLSVMSGVAAGIAHLLSIGAAWTYNSRIKLTPFSPLPWAASFALLVPYLSYGGDEGSGPSIVLMFVVGLLGALIHVLDALPDLVEDEQNQVDSLPVRLALKMGAASLHGFAWTATGMAAVLTVVVGLMVGVS